MIKSLSRRQVSVASGRGAVPLSDQLIDAARPGPAPAESAAAGPLRMRLREEVLAGCSAGVVGTVLGYPLDSLKTRMQTSGQTGLLSTLRQAVVSEGLLGLYRGIASPLLSLTLLNTLNFAAYSEFRRLLRLQGDVPYGEFDFRVPVAAACVGPLSALISTPFELIKVVSSQLLKVYLMLLDPHAAAEESSCGPQAQD